MGRKSPSPADAAITMPQAIAEAAMSEIGPKYRRMLRSQHTAAIVRLAVEVSAKIVDIADQAVEEHNRQDTLPLDPPENAGGRTG